MIAQQIERQKSGQTMCNTEKDKMNERMRSIDSQTRTDIDRPMKRKTDKQTNRQIDVQTDRGTNKQTDKYMNR